MPTRYQDFAQFQVNFDPRTMQTVQPVRRTDPAVFSGRMPTQFRVTQTVAQWTPQLNRLLTIPLEPTPAVASFDWDEVPDFKTETGLQRLRERINRSFQLSAAERMASGFTDMIAAGVLHGAESQLLLGSAGTFSQPLGQPVMVNTPNGQQFVQQSEAFASLLSVSSQPGFLGIVSEYAPAGGDRFEDLLMLDPTDSRQWLLIIMQPRGNDIHLYRRLYVLED